MNADFSTLIMSIGSSALIALGQSPNPSSGEIEKDLKMASFNIDLLKVLQNKTKGNLSDDESKFLNNLVSDLQVQFLKK